MATNETPVAWMLTLQYDGRPLGDPNYYYRLGANQYELIRTLQSAGFELVPNWPLDSGIPVRVGFMCVHQTRSGWGFGTAPHHYYLKDADLQTTIDALSGMELQHATRITDLIRRALGDDANDG